MNFKTQLLKVKNNQFLKASFFSAFSTSLKIITVLVIGKVVAVKSGASGMAIYGQLLNFVAIIIVVSGGAINDGVIKYVSEYKETNTEVLKKLFSTALKYLLYCSIVVGSILILFSKTLSLYVLKSIDYQMIFVLLGSTIFLYGLNNLLLAILNGYKNFMKFNFINIFINIISLLITLILIYIYDLFGALLGVVLNQSLLFVFTIYFLRNEKWFLVENFKEKFDIKIFKLLLKYASFGLLTVAFVPIVNFTIRNIIIENLSITAAGQYEFVTRISSSALVFFALTVSTYYLPRISEIFSKQELKNEITSTYKIMIPISLFILMMVYFFRFFIISLLASEDFYECEGLFLFQLTGVFLRLIAQISGFVLLAKAKIKEIILLEFVFNIFYIFTTLYAVKSYGLIGCAYAYLVYNFIYVIVVLLVFYRLFISNKSKEFY